MPAPGKFSLRRYIYLASTECDGPCFSDPGSAAWNNAVKSIVSHEMLHLLGAPDVNATSGNLMGYFEGKNNIPNAVRINDCVNQLIKTMRAFFLTGKHCTPPKH